MESRFGERKQKRRQNMYLNGFIGIVFILILIVGANLLRGTPEEKASSSPSQTVDNEQVNDEPESSHAPNQPEEEKQLEKFTEKENEEEDEETGEDDYTFSDGGPEGPWKPIGTKQSGEHITKFEKGTTEWDEMSMAVEYGAGLLDEDITLWRLGNGGDPQRALGQISNKAEPDKIYYVTIEWVDEEGWVPINVEIEN